MAGRVTTTASRPGVRSRVTLFAAARAGMLGAWTLRCRLGLHPGTFMSPWEAAADIAALWMRAPVLAGVYLGRMLDPGLRELVSRDAFDSSFDAVIELRRLTCWESHNLLSERAIGWYQSPTM